MIAINPMLNIFSKKASSIRMYVMEHAFFMSAQKINMGIDSDSKEEYFVKISNR